MKKQFSTFEVDKILKITHSSLQQWMNRGFIVPSIQIAKGRGTRSIFSLEDVYRARIFQELHRAGLPQSEASEHSKDMLLDMIQEGREWVIVIHRPTFTKLEHVTWEQLPEKIEKESYNVFVLVNVGKIIKEINLATEE